MKLNKEEREKEKADESKKQKEEEEKFSKLKPMRKGNYTVHVKYLIKILRFLLKKQHN